MTAPVKKPDRNTRHIKMRKLSDAAWWGLFTADLLAFVLAGPTRSWAEVNAWGRARWYTDVTIFNMVAYLDLTRQIAIISPAGETTLWGAPSPVEVCPACRAEKETGQIVHRIEFHSCRRGKERAA